MVFNFKKTFTLGSRAKSRDDDTETVVCLHYIKNAEFDTNYIISTGKRNNEEMNRVNDIKWNDVFADVVTNNGKSLDTSVYENSNEFISVDKPKNTETKVTVPKKSILKKGASTDTIPFENENKPVITFVSTKDYDGPSEEFAQKKKKVVQDETRTQRRDTKAIVALKKAREEEKERLKRAMEIEAESEGAQEENHDVTYKTRMSMLYSSQASSIFFTEDEPEANENYLEMSNEENEKHEYEEIDRYQGTGVLSAENDYTPEVYEEPEIQQVKKKKMADVKKNKQSVRNIKMQEGDDESADSNTSA